MKLYLSFVAAVLISIQGIMFASVEISNPRAIMDASLLIKSNQYPEFRARLSPDGKYILFSQQIDAVEEITKFYLQNIETGDEIEIPIKLPRGYGSVFSQVNFFNLKGDKLALFTVDEREDTSGSGAVSRTSEIKIFDIPSKKLINTGITGHFVMGQFDFSGNNLVLSLDNSFVTIASIKDFKPGKSIMSGWIHSCSPKTPYAAVFVPPSRNMSPEEFKRSKPQAEFWLLNLKTNESFILPTYSDNSQLDDITSHWSSDGSFLFYFDVKENNEGKQEAIARVWDVNSNTEKAVVPNVKCLGPGPADNLMIMVSTEKNISGSNLRLYDIKTDQLSSFGEGEIKGIHAWKNRIAYVETIDGVTGRLYVADITELKSGN